MGASIGQVVEAAAEQGQASVLLRGSTGQKEAAREIIGIVEYMRAIHHHPAGAFVDWLD